MDKKKIDERILKAYLIQDTTNKMKKKYPIGIKESKKIPLKILEQLVLNVRELQKNKKGR